MIDAHPSEFVQSSYDKNNEFAIDIIENYLIGKGYTIIPKAEDYGIDMIVEKDGERLLFEVEVKTGRKFTTKRTFPFDTVSFLGRKSKWVDTPFWYAIVCKETEYALFAHSSVIFKDEYKEVSYVGTSDRDGLDEFYRVPKELCYFGKVREI
tara:strand:- start:836 stop:1291 length:456 start_codon:yes stop_codon:yes gene_type:complete